MKAKRFMFLQFVLLPIHDLNSTNLDMFEFGAFENFQRNKELLLHEDALVKRTYVEQGIIN